ncbi:hypothetical protein D3871_12690 [Noviherbaspirillum saxi]|uniref:Uncharacterized protein n=1 Tax=Noviherbaspirillum saxi TaxID=2320863 RepID=A0A3A3FSX4_9BURK|nr:hypothetical protein D3871_12690 [Noviherbaspirillum saxi]
MVTAVCVAAALSACGGAPPDDDGNLSGAPIQGNRTRGFVASSSDFNPKIWDHHNWDECDCGRNANPSNAPWTGGK